MRVQQAVLLTGGPWHLFKSITHYARVRYTHLPGRARMVQGLVASAEAIILWAVSTDGHPIVRLLNGSDDNLWRVEPESGALARLTNDPEFESAVSASLVGDRVFFSNGRGPQYSEGLYIVNREDTVLWQYAFDCGTELCRLYYTVWSPDAAELAFSWWQVSGGATTYALYTVATDGSQSVPGRRFRTVRVSWGTRRTGVTWRTTIWAFRYLTAAQGSRPLCR